MKQIKQEKNKFIQTPTRKTSLIQRMLTADSKPQEFCNGVCFILWGCYNWTQRDVNNVSFIARWQQNTPANHMAAVRCRGVSQVAKETLWQRCRDTAATTQCELAPVCEILITLNNLLIYLLTHTISNWPKYYSARHLRTDWHAAKAVIVSISYKMRVRSKQENKRKLVVITDLPISISTAASHCSQSNQLKHKWCTNYQTMH